MTTPRKDKDRKSDENPTIAQNKRARYEYFIEEKLEAGLALQGWEVKSLRAGKAQITAGNSTAWSARSSARATPSCRSSCTGARAR